jgi:hypothetical protein
VAGELRSWLVTIFVPTQHYVTSISIVRSHDISPVCDYCWSNSWCFFSMAWSIWD